MMKRSNEDHQQRKHPPKKKRTARSQSRLKRFSLTDFGYAQLVPYMRCQSIMLG